MTSDAERKLLAVIAKGSAPVIRDYVDARLASLFDRIDTLETAVAGKAAADAEAAHAVALRSIRKGLRDVV
ncbi:hypothetical protein ATO13_17264 [Stappia sp. 22II-S9-Z10]|nr:hypothetical protein ATO13_17264 [Stappia sp. 22II-S9-Z10]